ncbi:MAG: hypothetical protein U9R56_07705, partial [candidate division Zixibacteria bacterium]|nr:hypothetical protein [candidate division Zixibacteria bacterium]
SSPGSIVLEGRHRFSTAQIKYAGWVYDDRYIDLTGGSKTGNIRRHMILVDSELKVRGKRTGQEGGLIKTIILLTEHTKLVNSLQYAGVNRDTVNIDLLSALVQDIRPGFVMRLDHLHRLRKRIRLSSANDQTVRQTRFEVRFTSGNLSTRSYIGYNVESGQTDFLSFFTRLVYRPQSLGQFELLSKLARFSLDKGLVDYWYMYARNERYLWNGLIMAVKLKHSCRRESGNSHQTVFTLELGVRL